MVNKKLFFYFYFFNTDFSLTIGVNVLKFSTDVRNIRMEGSVSQILDLGLRFCFIKKRVTFGHFFKLNYTQRKFQASC